MRLPSKLLRAAAGPMLALAATAAAAAAEPISVEQTIAHPDGVSLRLKTIEFGEAAIVVTAVVSYTGVRDIYLNRGHGFILDDGAHGIHHLSPPADNPDLSIAPRTQANAELVFIGPLASGSRELTLSANRGSGTRDNPYDDAPLLEARLPVAGRPSAIARPALSHPNGTALLVRRILVAPAACVVSLVATNGSDRTIILNHNSSLTLADAHGATAPLAAPAENRELVVPAGNRLDADLVFDCRKIDGSGTVTLTTNRGTGTPDNPYDSVPTLELSLPVEHSDGAVPANSRSAVAPIARSHLSEVIATAGAVASTPPPSLAKAAPLPPVFSAAPATPPSPPPTGVAPAQIATAASVAVPVKQATPKSVAQLEAALHAEKTDRGLRLVLPADSLFKSPQGPIDDAAAPLATLGELVAAMQPREVIIIGHTDSTGEDDANLALSKERAHAIAAWLAAHAAKPRPRFLEQGFGRTRPVRANHNADGSDSLEGQAANRRIEILLRRR